MLSSATVAAVLVAFLLVGRCQSVPTAPPPSDSERVLALVTGVSPDVAAAVGSGGVAYPFKPVNHGPLVGPDGKPEVLYIGAEWCPYCAAERWSLVVAASRFGRFTGLRLTRSSATDVYPNTPTLSFHGSSFSSPYLDFVAVETENRDRQPLESPTPQQRAAMAAADPAGSIPFVDLGGRLVAVGSGFPPDLLSGMTWEQIADRLKDPASPSTRAIVGNANYLTAGICQLTAGQPQSVCSATYLRALEARVV